MTTAAKRNRPSIYTLAIRSLTKALNSFGSRGRYWVQGNYGLDPLSGTTFSDAEVANVKLTHPLRMCSMGALLRADGPGEGAAIKLLAQAITGTEFIALRPDHVIIDFNDTGSTQFKDVRRMFVKAIRTAEQKRLDDLKARRKRNRQ